MSAPVPSGWSALRAGTELYARSEMHAAHEAWEAAWRARHESFEGQVARALAQLAAAGVHLESGRPAGFRSLGVKSGKRLQALAMQAEPVVGAMLKELAQRVVEWAAAAAPTLAERPPATCIPG